MTMLFFPFVRACTISLCVFLAFSSRAEAICAPRETGDINSPKQYMSALIDAAIVLHSAVKRSSELANIKAAMDGIAIFENAKQEYLCAQSYTAPFEKSSIQAVITSASALEVAATELLQVSEAERQEFKNLLDGKTEKPSENAERAGQLEVKGQDAWHFEMNAVLAASIALVEFGTDHKQKGLILTRAERDVFIAKIRKEFGNPSSHATVPPLDSSMIFLRDILADEKTRPSHPG